MAENTNADVRATYCDCCRRSGRPGFIENAGAWMHCPQCNRQPVQSGEYSHSRRPTGPICGFRGGIDGDE